MEGSKASLGRAQIKYLQRGVITPCHLQSIMALRVRETLVRMLKKKTACKAEVKKVFYQEPLWDESDTVQNQNRQGVKCWRRRSKLEGNMKNLSISWCVGVCFALWFKSKSFVIIYTVEEQTCMHVHVHVCRERERERESKPCHVDAVVMGIRNFLKDLCVAGIIKPDGAIFANHHERVAASPHNNNLCLVSKKKKKKKRKKKH